jgi:Integrase core domain
MVRSLMALVLRRVLAWLQRVLDEYVAYFNAWRPHQGLGQRAPCGSVPTAPSNPTGRIIGQPVLGGLHHVYHHAA